MTDLFRRMFRRKPAFPESRVAADFVRAVFDDAKTMLPNLCSSLEDELGRLRVVDTHKASLDLGLALVALELEALPNLFPPSKASRLRAQALAAVSRVDESEYPVLEVTAYDEILTECLARALNPIERVCERFLHRITHPEASYGPEAFTVDPFRVAVISTYVVGSVGRWKRLNELFEIVED